MAWESPVTEFEGLDLTSLGGDEAYLRVTSDLLPTSWLYSRSEDCYKCPWRKLYNISDGVYKLATHHKVDLMASLDGQLEHLPTESDKVLCEVTGHLGEFGVYDLSVGDICKLSTALESVNANLVLLVMAVVGVAGCLVWWGLGKIPGDPIHRVGGWLGWDKEETEKEGGGKVRLRSLDVFRGVSIAMMIFVNDGGGGYWFMEHSTWNGLYVADLVFPWFLWIMGVCIPMSVRSWIKKLTPFKTVLWQVTIRSIKLFALGFILNTLGGWIDLTRLRVPGVLQRFAICYWVVALLGFSLTYCSPKLNVGPMTDILTLLPHWMVFLAILAAHQLLVFMIPAPGCPTGYDGPGGLHDWTTLTNNTGCIGGITGYIDRVVFTTSHIYGNPTARAVYKAGAFDPEGLLGSLTSVFQVFLGYQAGHTLITYQGHKDRLLRWVIWGSVCGLLGALLCGARQEGGWIPVNKNLWSISFVLVTTCFAFLLLTFLYILIDYLRVWKGQPFVYAGMNSILLYCGHSVGYRLFPFHFIIGPMRTHAVKLPEALWGTSLWLVIAFVLYRKKVFVAV